MSNVEKFQGVFLQFTNTKKESREIQIAKENMDMLKALLKIDLKPSTPWVSTKNIGFRGNLTSGPIKIRSLNIKSRENQLSKINKENEIILTQLNSVKSVYSSKKWLTEYNKNREFIQQRNYLNSANRKHKISKLLLYTHNNMVLSRPGTSLIGKRRSAGMSFNYSPTKQADYLQENEFIQPNENNVYYRQRPKSMQLGKRPSYS